MNQYGNIQATCNTKRGPRTLNPNKIPLGYEHLACSTGICVGLLSGPEGAILSSRSLSAGQSCMKQKCQLEFVQGKVIFEDIIISTAGAYKLFVFSYIIDPYTHRVERWQYETPPF
jgi:hypothetical protein